jgi:hypothetical protein
VRSLVRKRGSRGINKQSSCKESRRVIYLSRSQFPKQNHLPTLLTFLHLQFPQSPHRDAPRCFPRRCSKSRISVMTTSPASSNEQTPPDSAPPHPPGASRFTYLRPSLSSFPTPTQISVAPAPNRSSQSLRFSSQGRPWCVV